MGAALSLAPSAACAIEIPDTSRFCLQCGKPAGTLDPDSVETIADDARTAWTGTYSGRSDLPLRVEAGAPF